MIGLSIKRGNDTNSEERKLLTIIINPTYCFTNSFLLIFVTIAFLKFSDVKPINQSILDISKYKKAQKN